MSLDPAVVLALAAHCARPVAAETLLAVARAESGLNPYAIGVNRAAPLPQSPQSAAEAAAVARRLLSAGANLDLGLAQINSANLERLGLTVEAAFDPCRNLAAAAQILAADYGVARVSKVEPQAALRIALSLYNTGDDARGFRNGYVTRVIAAAAGRKVPAPRRTPQVAAPRPAAWDAFGDLSAGSFVVLSPAAQGAIP